MTFSAIGGFNPAQIQQQMQQNMQNRFDVADSDQSGSLTFQEMLDSAPQDANNDRLEKVFAKMDSNGDGEVTSQEQNAMFDNIKQRVAGAIEERISQRMSGMTSSLTSAGSEQDKNPIEAILAAMSEDQEQGSEQQQKLQSMMENLKSEQQNPQRMQQAALAIRSMVTPIQTSA